MELVLSLQGDQSWLQLACTRTPHQAASAAAAKTRQETGHQPTSWDTWEAVGSMPQTKRIGECLRTTCFQVCTIPAPGVHPYLSTSGLTIISAIFFKVRTLCFCFSPLSSGGVSMYFLEKMLPLCPSRQTNRIKTDGFVLTVGTTNESRR